jgi:glutamine cyclotransferase
MKKILNFIFFILLISLTGCVKELLAPNESGVFNLDDDIAIIVNEGLYGYNNASISLLDLNDNSYVENIFEKVNLYELGDVANDAITQNNFLYVVVSNSKTLFKINLNTMKVISKLTFSGNNFPRKLSIINDSTLLLSDAYSSSIYKVNSNNMEVEKSINVGPQPEAIANFSHYAYVVNSGWGDINKNAANSSTISIIDLNNFVELKKIETGKDPVELAIDTINRYLYVMYYNYPSLKDSVGGIIQYDLSDLNNLNKTNEWFGNFSNLKISATGDTLFFIANNTPGKDNNKNGSIKMLDVQRNLMKDILVNYTPNFWYCFTIDVKKNLIWVGNAKNFTSDGEILVYSLNFNNPNEQPLIKYTTGNNPNRILLKYHN